MSVQYYDFEDKPIPSANYKEKPKREFRKEEKYYKVGDKKTMNPNFDSGYALEMKNEKIKALRMAKYPPLADLADAIYWEKKGNSEKMDQYISKCEKVKKEHPLD